MNDILTNQQVEGLVLRSYPSRDADLVYKILSPKNGKLACLGKNSRGTKKRFGGGVDIFDHGNFEFKAGRGSLPLVSSFHAISVYKNLRFDLNKLAAASCIAEAADNLIIEGSESHELEFKTIILGLTSIDQCENLGDILASTYQTLSSLLQHCGFLDERFKGRGSVKQLIELIKHLELVTEKESSTKDALLSSIREFKMAL